MALLRAGTLRSATGGATAYDAATVTAPAVPGNNVVIQNPFPHPVQIVISGGTMTAVVINGVTLGSGAGTYQCGPKQSIKLSYTVAPTWTFARSRRGAVLKVAGAADSAVVALETSPDNSTWTERDRVQGNGFAVAGYHIQTRYVRENVISLGGASNLRVALLANQ